MKILIIGGVAGGATAAARLRRIVLGAITYSTGEIKSLYVNLLWAAHGC